jgi:hypothetical protein
VADSGAAPAAPGPATLGAIDPLDDLVDAFLFGDGGPGRLQATLLVAERGLVESVVPRLVAAGTDGRRAAAAIESTLRQVGRGDSADVVRALLGPS